MQGGSIDLFRMWPVRDAWAAAVDAVAAAYRVEREHLLQESRGRGPRPPAHVWEAKKMAVHLAVILSGCTYAELGREIRLHKDTVSSHCADVRKLLMDDVTETSARTLEQIARVRLMGECRVRLDAARAHLELLSDTVSELMGVPRHPTFHPSLHPTLSDGSRNRDQHEEEAA